jgi:hypothetical protein
MRLIAIFAGISTMISLHHHGDAQPAPNAESSTKPLTSKSIANCALFTQTDRSDDGIAIVVANACGIPLNCKVSWSVVCAPDSAKRRVKHSSRLAFALEDGKQEEHTASPGVCKSDNWSIENIAWSCAPQ